MSTTVSEEIPVKSSQSFLALPHGSRHMSRYFWENQSGNGPACLVAQSQFHFDGMQSQLTQEEVRMSISLCHIVHLLSRERNENLARVLRLVVRHAQSIGASDDFSNSGISPEGKSLSLQYQSQVPMTYEDLRREFVHGKFAMIPSLPIPKVKLLDEFSLICVII